MPSRQERRKAERDATKRAPAQARAAGAAAALANLNVDPAGDWTTQAEVANVGPGGYMLAEIAVLITRETRDHTAVNDVASESTWPDPSAFYALGAEAVKQKADEGDRAAQYTLGCRLVYAVAGADGAGLLGAAGRSPKVEVGLAYNCTFKSLTRPSRVNGLLPSKRIVCGCQPWAEEGLALLEKAARQGHVYAMFCLGQTHSDRKEHVHAVKWLTEAAEAGLPQAMFNLGLCLDKGEEGVAAPDYPAAAGWYRRAADAGHGGAATNLISMYTVGRGRAGHTLHATSSSTCWTLMP